MNKKTAILLLALIALGACNGTKNTINEKHLIGSWLDLSKSKLHFSLFKDGTARSDNMQTLLYLKWRLDGTKLILTSKSIGNGHSSIGEETHEIKTLTEEKMILQPEHCSDCLWEFVKKK